MTRHIAMFIYPQFTALDMVGPHHVLSIVPDIKVHLVAATAAPITSDLGLTVTPTCTFDTCPADLEVLFTPGGTRGTLAAMQDPATLRFFRDRAARAKWVTSVCTGSLILGAAGLLQGKRATSHWVAVDELARFGATPVKERVVRDGNVMTGGGVTAGIDFALTLATELADETLARRIQLGSEYDPAPPYNSGSPATALPEHTAAARAHFAPFVELVRNAVIPAI